jgi:hypothetical protein
MVICEFTYKHYTETINEYIKSGYSIINVSDYFEGRVPQGKVMILRHDIDYSIMEAVKMASIENSMGIKSTYYVMLHNHYYNILTPMNLHGILKIQQLGHEVSLHFESKSDFDRDVKILNEILGVQTKTYSWHSPTCIPEKIKRNLPSAYDEKLLNEFKYISESCHRWREGCFCNWINKKDRMYVLTHSLWWGNKDLDFKQLLGKTVADMTFGIEEFYEVNLQKINIYLKELYGAV